jgi:hypothetical protein
LDDGATDDDNDHLLVVLPLSLRVAQIVKNIGSITYLREMILEIILVYMYIFFRQIGIKLQCMGSINQLQYNV